MFKFAFECEKCGSDKAYIYPCDKDIQVFCMMCGYDRELTPVETRDIEFR